MKNLQVVETQKLFQNHFGSHPSITIKCPGRLNFIGEHTDYTGGYVLPAAINRFTICCIRKNNLGQHRFFAADLNKTAHIDISHTQLHKIKWLNFFIGILNEFNTMTSVTGMDCVIKSNIPIGAGLSSSSAMECAFIMGLDQLFNTNLSRIDMIEISKRSNHTFLGIKGGIMDQFTCFYGKADHAILLKCQDNSHQYIPIALSNHTIVLVDTKVQHDLADSAYTQRVMECRQALADIQQLNPHVNSLLDVSVELIGDLQFKLDPILLKRVKYFVEENNRVLKFSKLLSENKITQLGEILYDGHEGLRHLYEISCPELDFLVDQTRPMNDVIGSRMMGGGFGGCTINIVEQKYAPLFKKQISELFRKQFHRDPEVYEVDLVDGCTLV